MSAERRAGRRHLPGKVVFVALATAALVLATRCSDDGSGPTGDGDPTADVTTDSGGDNSHDGGVDQTAGDFTVEADDGGGVETADGADAGPTDNGLPACEYECAYRETSCVESVSYRECGDFDEDRCLEWRDLESCGTNASCVGGECSCNAGFEDCNTDWADGCESNPDNDPENCGGCHWPCFVANVQTVLCVGGGCDYDSCIPPFADNDGDRANGCEAGSYFPRVIGRDNIDGDYLSGFLRTGDGGYVGAGTAEVRNPDRIWPMWIIKLDGNGDTQWEKWYCDKSVCSAISIHLLDGAGFMTAGSFRDGKYADTDLLFVFVDEVGDITRARHVRGCGRRRHAVALGRRALQAFGK